MRDVILNESNVSTQHARFTVSEDKILLEDLGSTNGTSVGSVANKVHRAEIEMGDTIYFGSVAYRVADLIKQHQGTKPPAPASATPPGRAHSPLHHSKRAWLRELSPPRIFGALCRGFLFGSLSGQ